MTLDDLIELLETTRNELKAETGKETFYMLNRFGSRQVDYTAETFEHPTINAGHYWYGIHLRAKEIK